MTPIAMVTGVIPFFNRSNTIKRAVDSGLNQTFAKRQTKYRRNMVVGKVERKSVQERKKNHKKHNYRFLSRAYELGRRPTDHRREGLFGWALPAACFGNISNE